jgi:hypothetical protein
MTKCTKTEKRSTDLVGRSAEKVSSSKQIEAVASVLRETGFELLTCAYSHLPSVTVPHMITGDLQRFDNY